MKTITAPLPQCVCTEYVLGDDSQISPCRRASGQGVENQILELETDLVWTMEQRSVI